MSQLALSRLFRIGPLQLMLLRTLRGDWKSVANRLTFGTLLANTVPSEPSAHCDGTAPGALEDAAQLPHRAREAGVGDGVSDEIRVRRALEDADAAAHHGARAAYGTLERGDLRRSAVRPRKSDARADVQLVRRDVVARPEDLLDVRVVRRHRVEPIGVESDAVLDLQVARTPVRVAECERRGDGTGALDAIEQRTREERRPVRREIGERVVAEG